MARKKKFVPFTGAKCSGEYFTLKYKTKKGKTVKRCACAAFTDDGRFVTQFAGADTCSLRGKALTAKQAQRKFA